MSERRFAALARRTTKIEAGDGRFGGRGRCAWVWLESNTQRRRVQREPPVGRSRAETASRQDGAQEERCECVGVGASVSRLAGALRASELKIRAAGQDGGSRRKRSR